VHGAHRLAAQLGELRSTLPAAVRDVVEQMSATPFGVWAANNLPNIYAIVPDTAQLLTRATGILSGAAGMLAGVLIVIFAGIAGALEPALYVNGFVQVFPAPYRTRLRGVLNEISRTLRMWLVARLLTMAATTLLVTIGLTALHIPLAIALGVLAGVLAFIPNIGAIVAAAPALILAFVISPKLALTVFFMYIIVHVLDDLVISPVVERQVVKLPPILTLVAQVVLGVGAGAIGIMLAAPLVTAAMVLVRRLWIEDVANEHASGRPAPPGIPAEYSNVPLLKNML